VPSPIARLLGDGTEQVQPQNSIVLHTQLAELQTSTVVRAVSRWAGGRHR
jgi:hypothetical protein